MMMKGNAMKMIIEFDALNTVEIDGDYTFETAEALIEIFDNAEAYMGGDIILVDEEAGKQWVFSEETWEEIV
jgi:hypothetical protein